MWERKRAPTGSTELEAEADWLCWETFFKFLEITLKVHSPQQKNILKTQTQRKKNTQKTQANQPNKKIREKLKKQTQMLQNESRLPEYSRTTLIPLTSPI